MNEKKWYLDPREESHKALADRINKLKNDELFGVFDNKFKGVNGQELFDEISKQAALVFPDLEHPVPEEVLKSIMRSALEMNNSDLLKKSALEWDVVLKVEGGELTSKMTVRNPLFVATEEKFQSFTGRDDRQALPTSTIVWPEIIKFIDPNKEGHKAFVDRIEELDRYDFISMFGEKKDPKGQKLFDEISKHAALILPDLESPVPDETLKNIVRSALSINKSFSLRRSKLEVLGSDGQYRVLVDNPLYVAPLEKNLSEAPKAESQVTPQKQPQP